MQNPKRERTYKYCLTPKRKKIGKAVARKSFMSLAEECLKKPSIMCYILKKMGRIIRNELRCMCSNGKPSLLRSQSPHDLVEFKWENLYKEVQERAPTFLKILNASTQTRVPRHNQKTIICLCCSIILKHRYQHMSLVQKLIGLVLYGTNVQKMVGYIYLISLHVTVIIACTLQVYERLSVIGVCVSHKTVTKLVEKLSHDHDQVLVVKTWRDKCSLKIYLTVRVILYKMKGYSISCLCIQKANDILQSLPGIFNEVECNQECNSSTSTDSEDLDYFVTEESDSDKPLEYVSSDTSEADTDTSDTSFSDMETSSTTPILTSNVQSSSSLPEIPLPFKIVGDNIDKNIRPRYVRSNAQSTSIHYFHSYALRDRIDFQTLSHQQPSCCLPSQQDLAESILPSTTDDEMLRNNVIVIVSRILVQYIDFFNKSFADVVQWHIKHKYYKEMSTKSEVVRVY